jgi:type IV pilus assembly protein PilO
MALPKINLDSVLKLPLAKRVLILLAINVAVGGLVYWFLTGPKYGEIKKLNVELEQLTAKLVENRQIASDIPKYIREKEEMEAKLEAAVAQLPNAKEIPDLIDGISSSAERSGLKIQIFRPGKEVPKGFYAEVPVKMTVEGKYESLYEFSGKIGNLPRIVNLGGMNIVSTGHKNRVPVLKADFTATTFRFIPQSEVAEKAEGKPGKKK